MAKETKGKFDKTFEMLEQLVDQKIFCIYTEIGINQFKGLKGTLNEITPYDSVVIEGRVLRFIGNLDAIVMLGFEMDGKPKALYYNKNIKKMYHGYSNDPLGLISAQKEQLGYSVKEQEYFNTSFVSTNNISKMVK